MLRHCACCNAVYRVPSDAEACCAYCDRCEVAYLEFKLGLLVATYRTVMKKESGREARRP